MICTQCTPRGRSSLLLLNQGTAADKKCELHRRQQTEHQQSAHLLLVTRPWHKGLHCSSPLLPHLLQATIFSGLHNFLFMVLSPKQKSHNRCGGNFPLLRFSLCASPSAETLEELLLRLLMTLGALFSISLCGGEVIASLRLVVDAAGGRVRLLLLFTDPPWYLVMCALRAGCVL